jgi:hypothetical protein
LVKIADRERFEMAESRRLARLAKAGRPSGRRHLSQIRGTAASGLDPRSWSARPLKIAQTYWWVPAGFAVLVLLRTIVGG